MEEPRQNGPLREVLVVGAICVVAVAVRLLFLTRWADTLLFQYPIGDELNFHETALSLLGKGAPPEMFTLYQPLYAFYLASVYGLFGVDVGLVRTIQLFIGVGTCLVFYGLGRELAGRWAGRLSAFVVAVYGPLVFFEGQLLAPVLTVPLIAGAFWCLLAAGKRDIPWLQLPAGALIGLALMARPNLAIILPVAGIWLLTRPFHWKRRCLAALLALTGVACGLLPSWLHNALRGGAAPVSASGGHSFYIGNSRGAPGVFYLFEGITPSGQKSYRQSVAGVAERAEGRELTPSEVSSYWYRRGLDFWAEYPGEALALTGKKLLLSIQGQEMAIHHSYSFGKELAPVLRWLLSFGVLFPFYILGVVFSARRRDGAWMIAVCSFAYFATLIVYYVADRYRIVLLPMVISLASLGMLELYDRCRRGGWRKISLSLGILAVAFSLSHLPVVPDAWDGNQLAFSYNWLGRKEISRGDLERGEAFFEKAAAAAGGNRGPMSAWSWSNLGDIRMLKRDPRGARQRYLRAIAAEPKNGFVRIRLARLDESQGKLDEAIRWWQEVAELMPDPGPARREVSRLQALKNVVEPER
jgi:4-amino-4-deoxy-L-arabinose transferase-like glycosyltransferase